MNIIDITVPEPFRLNCWKHHAGYIRMRINEVNNSDKLSRMIKEMLAIGNSQMDLYTGGLTPAEICSSVIMQLKEKNIDSFETYSDWIYRGGKDFQLLLLIDGSKWALRMGNEEGRYIHIHPGRYSINSVRVKAAALKTAAAALMWKNLNNLPELDLSIINHVRKNLISAPPIKAIQNKGLMKIISLLESKKINFVS
jgi:hypothetical protein